MSSDLPPLAIATSAAARGEPCVLEVASRLFGDEIAEVLWRGFAGQRLYIPKRPGPDHELSRLIGQDKAAMLGAELGGIVVCMLAGTIIKQRRVVRLRKTGMTAREIVKKTGYVERHVYRIIRDARAAGLLPRRVRVDHRPLIRSRTLAGANCHEIAREAGLSPVTVSRLQSQLRRDGALPPRERSKPR